MTGLFVLYCTPNLTGQAKNIPYQPLLVKTRVQLTRQRRKIAFFKTNFETGVVECQNKRKQNRAETQNTRSQIVSGVYKGKQDVNSKTQTAMKVWIANQRFSVTRASIKNKS